MNEMMVLNFEPMAERAKVLMEMISRIEDKGTKEDLMTIAANLMLDTLRPLDDTNDNVQDFPTVVN